MSRLYAEVIGDPIAHSKSPLIHNFWLEKLGIDAEYRACHVRPDALADYIARRRTDADWRGCNVTIPHKVTTRALVDVDMTAMRVGAVNTLVHLAGSDVIGMNTDVDGVIGATALVNFTDCKVVVLGAGGAARAALESLWSEDGVGEVVVLARNQAKAQTVTDEIGLNARVLPFEAGTSALAGAGLLVNATQLGMAGQQPMPLFVMEELSRMALGAHVFDMVYVPLETELLRAARAEGKVAIDGLAMLIGQAAAAFEKFFGQPAPREHDAELRSLLTA